MNLERRISDLVLQLKAALVARARQRIEAQVDEQVAGLVGGVRTCLVERIARETEPGAFWNLAGALGALQEPRGAEAVRLQRILGPTWGGVRGYILYDIGRMGGPAAIRLLEDYLLLPSADHVGAALQALAKSDLERARSHALRIRRSDRCAFLDVMDRVQVDSLSG